MSSLKIRNSLENSPFFSCGRKFVPWLLLFGLWMSIILPSTFHPQWTYLDLPYVLKTISLAPPSHLLTQSQISGRFFPFFSISYALIFKIWGFNLYGYYLVQAVFFLIVLGLMYGLVRRITHSLLIPLLTIFLISTASPVAENFYTICKQDPLALLFVSLLICLCHRHMETDSLARSGRKWLLLATIGCIALLALLTKETTAVFIVFPISGAVLAYFFSKWKVLPDTGLFRSFGWMTLFAAAALGAVRVLCSALKPVNSSQVYISYPVNKELIFSNLDFYWNQQPDVVLTGIGALSLLIILFVRKEAFPRQFIFSWALFLTGTAYFVGHLFWRWPLGYYLLIPSTLWAAAFAISLGFLPPSGWGRIFFYAGLALIFLTRIYSLSYFYYIARAQKTQDQIYTAAIEKYLQLAKNGERLIVEQWSFYEEGVQQSNILVKQIFKRPLLKVEGVHDLLEGRTVPQEILGLFGASAAEGQNREPRESDFILTFTGKGHSSWFLRGVAPFPNQHESEYKNGGMLMDLRAGKEIRWKYLNEAAPFRSLNFQEYRKGYLLYQVKDPSTFMSWKGRWRDGWIGEKAQLSLNLKNPKEELVFQGTLPSFATPNSLTVRWEGRVLRKIDLRDPGIFSFRMQLKPSSGSPTVELEIAAEKTFIPKEIGLNPDTRILSVQITDVRRGQ
jgi:hypothetical protein